MSLLRILLFYYGWKMVFSVAPSQPFVTPICVTYNESKLQLMRPRLLAYLHELDELNMLLGQDPPDNDLRADFTRPPWSSFGLLWVVNASDVEQSCTAQFTSSSYMLSTAAHCVFNRTERAFARIIFFIHKFDIYSKVETYQIKAVHKACINPFYDFVSLTHSEAAVFDFALLATNDTSYKDVRFIISDVSKTYYVEGQPVLHGAYNAFNRIGQLTVINTTFTFTYTHRRKGMIYLSPPAYDHVKIGSSGGGVIVPTNNIFVSIVSGPICSVDVTGAQNSDIYGRVPVLAGYGKKFIEWMKNNLWTQEGVQTQSQY